jgi:hypothetical protein
MRRIPHRYAHFVFGVIQSGLTSAIATGVASFDYPASGIFIKHWMTSWLFAWGLMLPLVIVAAPVIRRITVALTQSGNR